MLDETDRIANILDPALAELESASTSYFAYKRLDNVNSTFHKLQPLVDDFVSDPNLLELGPLKDDIKSLEDESDKIEMLVGKFLQNYFILPVCGWMVEDDLILLLQMEQMTVRGMSMDEDADESRVEALKMEKALLEVIKRTFSIVESIRVSLWHQLIMPTRAFETFLDIPPLQGVAIAFHQPALLLGSHASVHQQEVMASAIEILLPIGFFGDQMITLLIKQCPWDHRFRPCEYILIFSEFCDSKFFNY